jgi:hypothetical protein
MFEPNTVESKLALERLLALGAGIQARRADQPLSSNPFANDLLRASQARSWEEGWRHEDQRK